MHLKIKAVFAVNYLVECLIAQSLDVDRQGNDLFDINVACVKETVVTKEPPTSRAGQVDEGYDTIVVIGTLEGRQLVVEVLQSVGLHGMV